MKTITVELAEYIADFINEEIDRGNEIDYLTIVAAIEAFEGGAR